jgi:hypothetical protein
MTVTTPRAGESGPPGAAARYALGSNEDETKRGSAPTRPGTPAAPCWPTWCAACAR